MELGIGYLEELCSLPFEPSEEEMDVEVYLDTGEEIVWC